MEITTRQAQASVPVTILEVKGDIDVATSPALLEQARAAVAGGARKLIVDLSGAPYVSSAGIRALHQVFMLLRTDAAEESDVAMLEGMRAGTFVAPHLRLVGPTARVAETLKNSGLDMYLSVHPTQDAALAGW
jgi:anti-anti-sigma factor